MPNTKIPNCGMHHLALFVKDFDKSYKFYTEGLGFTFVAGWGEGDKRAAMLDIGDGGRFEVFAGGPAEEERNARFAHFAFSTTDAGTAYNNAIAAGAVSHIEPKDVDIPSDPVMKVRIAFVKGFDGEVLEFFENRKD